MKEIIFDKKEYASYKDMYHDICIKLDKDRFIDWKDDYEDLGYSADLLNEFLWYCHDDSNKYILVNFDKKRVALQKNYNDYKYNLVIEVFERFVKQYPNNKLEFRMENIKKENYIFVHFENNSMEYIYKSNLNLKPGNIVEAPTLNYVIKQNAIVTEVVELADFELPIEKTKILTITKFISEKDENGVFDKIGYIKNLIDKKYLKEWKLHYEDYWLKCWKSTFGYTISYEQDGVLEVFYFDKKTEFVFRKYTITDQDNLDIKLAFVKTITSQLFYKLITKDDFITKLEKLP